MYIYMYLYVYVSINTSSGRNFSPIRIKLGTKMVLIFEIQVFQLETDKQEVDVRKVQNCDFF